VNAPYEKFAEEVHLLLAQPRAATHRPLNVVAIIQTAITPLSLCSSAPTSPGKNKKCSDPAADASPRPAPEVS
jgi:hypothetical protein